MNFAVLLTTIEKNPIKTPVIFPKTNYKYAGILLVFRIRQLCVDLFIFYLFV